MSKLKRSKGDLIKMDRFCDLILGTKDGQYIVLYVSKSLTGLSIESPDVYCHPSIKLLGTYNKKKKK